MSPTSTPSTDGVHFGQSVIHRLIECGRKFPERPALWTREGVTTYADLFRIAASIRAELRAGGHEHDAAVGVLTGDDLFTYASILAILANGSAYVPINNKNPRDRIRRIVERSGVSAILRSRDYAELSAAVDSAVQPTDVLDTRDIDVRNIELDPPRIREDDLAYIFFTSGSTGEPKGVPIRHRSLNAFFSVVLDRSYWVFSEEDRFLQMFELTFDLSVVSLFTPLCVGACAYVVPETGIAYLNVAEILDSEQITVALMVPSMLSYLEGFFDEIRLEQLRYSQFCGEALPDHLVAAWSRCVPNARIENVYGPTEATIYCSVYEWNADLSPGEAVHGIVPIGKPMPGVEMVVVDEQRRLVKDGETGELCLCGDQVTDGYWNSTEKTAEAFIELRELPRPRRFYRTGDLAYLNDKGDFVYCGRSDFQVKIDGYRIELSEIEHHARAGSGSSLVAAVQVTGAAGGMELALFVETDSLDTTKLREHLRAQLPTYMLPKHIRAIESMPLNLNGKIDRPALAALLRP